MQTKRIQRGNQIIKRIKTGTGKKERLCQSNYNMVLSWQMLLGNQRQKQSSNLFHKSTRWHSNEKIHTSGSSRRV